MRQHGIHFAVVRGWQSSCHVDPAVVNSVKAAHAAGMPNVDVYLFPSYNCHLSAEAQVDGLIAALHGHKYGMIWLDIESGGGWSSSGAANLKWIQKAAARIRAKLGPKAVGIYASANSWSEVCKGEHAAELTEYPLCKLNKHHTPVQLDDGLCYELYAFATHLLIWCHFTPRVCCALYCRVRSL